MSELKEWTASEIEEYDDARLELAEDGKIDCTRVYIKEDVDKVIAKLKDKLRVQTSIAEEGWKEFRTYHTSYAEAVKELYEKNKELRRYKYKRCLNEASYWVAVSYQCVDDKHRQRAERHHRKWLELAKKFNDKEAK